MSTNLTPKEKMIYNILTVAVVSLLVYYMVNPGEKNLPPYEVENSNLVDYLANPDEKNLPPYEIERNKCLKPYKCVFDIRIKTKLSIEELTAIAKTLKAESPPVERIFIGYYLPCMIPGNGSWATSNFNPDLKIEFPEYILVTNPACD
jgi:hypothetical protein